jgi:hypothetical protein
MTEKSPLELAREYEARLEYYLANVEALPSRAGKINVSAVAAACGFDRQILYKNGTARAMLEHAVREKGLIGIEAANAGPGQEDETGDPRSEGMVPISKLREEQRRCADLEKRLVELTARNAELSARLRRQSLIEDELIANGRRSRPLGFGTLFGEGKA